MALAEIHAVVAYWFATSLHLALLGLLGVVFSIDDIRFYVTVYEVRTSRALSQRSSLLSMSAFHTGIH
jgi:hypothetical protein